MKTSYTCVDAKCPRCSAKLTGASDPAGGAVPTADDLSVCAYCGAVIVFNNDLTLREATRADIETLPLEVAYKLGQIVGMVHLRLQKERNGPH